MGKIPEIVAVPIYEIDALDAYFYNLRLDTAKRMRHCKKCELPIPPGEHHYYEVIQRPNFEQRITLCMLCSLPLLEKNLECAKLNVPAVKKYIEDHPEIKGRKVLTNIKKKCKEEE